MSYKQIVPSFFLLYYTMGFLGGASQETYETWVWSLGWEDPLEEGMATHPSIPCLENPHRQRSLVHYIPWGRQELDTTERLNTAQIQGILKGKVSNDFRILILCNYPVFFKVEGYYYRSR